MESKRNRARMTGVKFGEPFVVRAKNNLLRRLRGELLELPADGFPVGVVIQVLFIDVQDNGILRMKIDQRAVAFVSLRHEPTLLIAGETRVPRQLRNPSAHG